MAMGTQRGLVLCRAERVGGGVYTGFFRTRDFGMASS
jgi:hypothetical protein